jgi:hypothetical protein
MCGAVISQFQNTRRPHDDWAWISTLPKPSCGVPFSLQIFELKKQFIGDLKKCQRRQRICVKFCYKPGGGGGGGGGC